MLIHARDLIENCMKIHKGVLCSECCSIDVFMTYMSLIKGQCRVMVVVIMTKSLTLVTDK